MCLGYFVVYEQFEFHAQMSWAWKKFYNLGARQDKDNNTLGIYCSIWIA